MSAYRVTKYDPARRDERGAYPNDDWICPSQIGEVIGGIPLTLDGYLKAESAYVEGALALWKAAGAPRLFVTGLERHGVAAIHPELARLVHEVQYSDGLEVKQREHLADLIRVNLRTLIWCQLKSKNGFYVHTGYDYYMYVGGVEADESMRQYIASLGLFIEPCESPVAVLETELISNWRAAAESALEAHDLLMELWREMEERRLCPRHSSLLRSLIKRRIYPVNAFAALAKADLPVAIDVLLSRYIGRDVDPDRKFGGFSFELETMLEDLVEAGGQAALDQLLSHPEVSPTLRTDPRVMRAIENARNVVRDLD